MKKSIAFLLGLLLGVAGTLGAQRAFEKTSCYEVAGGRGSNGGGDGGNAVICWKAWGNGGGGGGGLNPPKKK